MDKSCGSGDYCDRPPRRGGHLCVEHCRQLWSLDSTPANVHAEDFPEAATLARMVKAEGQLPADEVDVSTIVVARALEWVNVKGGTLRAGKKSPDDVSPEPKRRSLVPERAVKFATHVWQHQSPVSGKATCEALGIPIGSLGDLSDYCQGKKWLSVRQGVGFGRGSVAPPGIEAANA